MQNQVGPPVEGENFHGREHELGVIRRLIESWNDVLILSPRRVGKTSVTLETIRKVKEDGWIGIFCDVEHATDEGHFLDLLRKAIEIPELPKKLRRRVSGAIERFRRTLGGGSVKVASVELSLSENSETLDWKTASEAIEELLAALAGLEQPVVLVLDELPIFLSKLIRQRRKETAIDVLNWLRSVRKVTRKGFAWIFAGSVGLDSQVEYLGVPGTINDLKIEQVGAMSVAETTEMLHKLAANNALPLDISAEAVRQIIDRVGWLIPSYVQLVYHALSELAPEKRSAQYPGAEDVDMAYEELMGAHYATKFVPWDARLDEPFIDKDDAKRARRVLAILCVAPQGELHDSVFQRCLANEPNVDEEDFGRAMSRVFLLLERDGYLARGDGQLAFRSPLLRDYWARHHHRH